MPTYDYKCANCGYEFEAFHSMSAEPLKDCPECEQPELNKVIGAGSGLIFKGTGFYETDYKRKSGGESKSAETASSSGKD